MDFRDVVRHRRMVRRFAQRPVPPEVIDRILDTGRRAPSAGFSQGLELLVLDTPETVATFWETTRDPRFGWDEEDVANGPTVLILPLPDARRYLDRYSQPDKIDFGMDEEANWPVRFWEIDAAMASMLILLAAVDEGLGAWFFGIAHGERELLDRFDVPSALRPIGIIGLGYRADDEEPSGSWMKRRRRPFEDQVHRNGW
ncbi:MAG TPA: nitroreductase family protein [Actinomycetota bacterium]|nr:nitroreductase family protein [Actinomycetota bacterium]